MNIKTLSTLAALLLTSISAHSLETRANYPMIQEDDGDGGVIEKPIETRIYLDGIPGSSFYTSNTVSACKAFSMTDLTGDDAGVANYENAHKGNVAYPHPYDIYTSELSSEATTTDKYNNQPFDEYKLLIQQNQWCNLFSSYLYKRSFADTSILTYKDIVTPINYESYVMNISIRGEGDVLKRTYQNVDELGYGGVTTLGTVDEWMNSRNERVMFMNEAVCRIYNDPDYVGSTSYTKSLQAIIDNTPDTSSIYDGTGLPLSTITGSNSFFTYMRDSVFPADSDGWKEYCEPITAPESLPAPDGKEASALLTLNGLGYKQVPQTRVDGEHDSKNLKESPYSIGLISVDDGISAVTDQKSQFAIMSDEGNPYMSTGIQNAPFEANVGGNPHKFYYEQYKDEFLNTIKQKVNSLAQYNEQHEAELLKAMGNKSSNPTAKGYAIKPNMGADAQSISTAAAGLLKVLHRDKFLIGTPHANESWYGSDWPSNPFRTGYLQGTGTHLSDNAKHLSLRELYEEGYNWDNGACNADRAKAPESCVFAFSLVVSGAGCGGMYLTNGALNNRIDELSQEYRNDGRGWYKLNEDFILTNNDSKRCELAGPPWSTYNGVNESVKADLFYEVPYDKLDTKFSFRLDDLGVLLRPGYFFSKNAANIANLSVSQLKMARYEQADNTGMNVHKVDGAADISLTSKYQTTAKYCTDRGMDAVVRDGKTYCESEPCSDGFSFDSDTGACVKDNSIPCLLPEFTDPNLDYKPETVQTSLQNGLCVSTYEVNPKVQSGYFDSNNQQVPVDSTGLYAGSEAPTEVFNMAPITKNEEGEWRYGTHPDHWRQAGTKKDGTWVLSSDKINQNQNGNPTLYVKNKLYGYGTFEGEVVVNTPPGWKDDDFVGLAFGYRSKDKALAVIESEIGQDILNSKGEPTGEKKTAFDTIPLNEYLDGASEYYTIIWNKQEETNDVGANRGFFLQYNKDYGDGTINNQTLAYNFNSNIGGWDFDKPYTIKLVVTPSNVKMYAKESHESRDKYELIIDATANYRWHSKGLVKKDDSGNYYFPTGRFGFYNRSQDQAQYSGFKVTDYTEIKCDGGDETLKNEYGMPNGQCKQFASPQCEAGLSPIANNGSINCGQLSEKCSMADLSKSVVNGKVVYGKCSHLASDSTSIDVLKDITSRVFYNDYYKRMGSLNMVKPIDITGQEVPSSIVDGLQDSANWLVDENADYSKLNKILASSPSITQEEFNHILETYHTNEKSREKFKQVIGMDMDKLPEFQVDAMALSVGVELREFNDLSLGKSEKPLSCNPGETELSRFPAGDSYPVSIRCVSIKPTVDGLYKYKWDPKTQSMSVPFSIKLADKKTLLVESNNTYLADIPESANINVGSSDEELVNNVTAYLNQESSESDSLIAAGIQCSKYIFDVSTPIRANNSEALIKGSVSCYNEDVATNKKQAAVFSKFVSQSPAELKTELSDSPDVIAKIGRQVDNPLQASCRADLSDNTKLTNYKINKILDSVSGQKYEDKDAFASKITLNYPEVKTTNHIKNNWIKKEANRHLNKFLGVVEYDEFNELKRINGQVSISQLAIPNSTLYSYLTESGRSALAETIFSKVKNSYPYSKDKMTVRIPVSSFETNLDLFKTGLKELRKDIYTLTNSIDSDKYNDIPTSTFTEFHNDQYNTLNSVAELNNKSDNGVILPLNVLNIDTHSQDVGRYELTEDQLVIYRNPMELPITDNKVVSDSCSFIDPVYANASETESLSGEQFASDIHPNIVRLENGSMVAAWRTSYGGRHVVAQLLDSNANPVGDLFKVDDAESTYYVKPELVALKNGNFVVIWLADGPNTDYGKVYGQIFTPEGVKVGSKFQISDDNVTLAWFTAASTITTGSEDGFVVAYSNKREQRLPEQPPADDLYVQRMSNTGEKIGPVEVITTHGDGAFYPDIAPVNGGYVVVWYTKSQETRYWSVYGQMYDVSHNKSGQQFHVSHERPVGVNAYPTVGSTTSGDRFVIAWENRWNRSSKETKVIFKSYDLKSLDSVAIDNWTESSENVYSNGNNYQIPTSLSVQDDYTVAISTYHHDLRHDLITDLNPSLFQRVTIFDRDGKQIGLPINPALNDDFGYMYRGVLERVGNDKFALVYHRQIVDENTTTETSKTYDIYKVIIDATAKINAEFKLLVNQEKAATATPMEVKACTELYGEIDADAEGFVLDTKIKINDGVAIFDRKPLVYPLPVDADYQPLLNNHNTATFLGCNTEALSVDSEENTFACDTNNIHSFGSNKWSVIDPADNENKVFIEMDTQNVSPRLKSVKNNTITSGTATFHSRKFSVDESGKVVQNPTDEYTKSSFSTSNMNDILNQLVSMNNALKIKMYPINFGRETYTPVSDYITFTIDQGQDGVDDEMAESISEVRDVCLGVSDYDNDVAKELIEVSEIYSFIRKNVDEDKLIQILMSEPSRIRSEPYDGREVQNRNFFKRKWSGNDDNDIRSYLSAKVQAEDALMTYVDNECKDTSSIYSTSKLSTGTSICSKIDEFLVNDYSKDYGDFGVKYTMTNYKDFFTSPNPGSSIPLKGFGNTLMSGLAGTVKNVAFSLLGLVEKRDWRFSVVSRHSLKTQVLRGLTIHESEFLRQAAGSIDTNFVEQCVTQMGSAGEFTNSKRQINFTRLLSNPELFKHLDPKVRSMTADEYATHSDNFTNEYSTASETVNIAGKLNEVEAGNVCSNFLKEKDIVGHPIFNNESNTELVEGLNIGADGMVNIISPRVIKNNNFVDSKSSPNWLQGKVCKDSYMSVPYALSQRKVKENPQECDGSIYSAKCAADSRPKVTVWRLLTDRSGLKRDFRNWSNDTLQMTTNICGHEPTSATSADDLATPNDRDGKTIIFTETAGGASSAGYSSHTTGLLYGVESGVLVHGNDVDKAKMGIHLIDNPDYSNTLMINSMDVFSGIVNKKSGITRETPNHVFEDVVVPPISIDPMDPIENMVNKCMDFKSEVAYKKPKSYGGYKHIYNAKLVKTYPNKDLDFIFVDPRNNQERSVKRCSDIFVQADDVFDSTEGMSRKDRKELYLKEFLSDQNGEEMFGEDQEELKSGLDSHAKELKQYNAEDGYNISEQNNNEMLVTIGRDKEKGFSQLQNETAKQISTAVPDTDGKNMEQKQAMANAKKFGGASADSNISSGFDALIKVIEVSEGLGSGVMDSNASHLKGAVKTAKTVATVAGAANQLQAIKDQNMNLQNVMDAQDDEFTGDKSQVGGITVTDSYFQDQSPEALVDKVMAFDDKMLNMDEEQDESLYDAKRREAEAELNSSRFYQSLPTNKIQAQLNDSAQMRSEVNDFNQFRSSKKTQSEMNTYYNSSNNNNSYIKFNASRDYNSRQNSNFDENNLTEAYEMMNGTTGAIYQDNINNAYNSFENVDTTASTGENSLQFKLQQQIKHQTDSFGIFNERGYAR